MSESHRRTNLPSVILRFAVFFGVVASCSNVHAVTYEYVDGTFGGQRGAGMIFAGMVDDGWIEHWSEVPDPDPATSIRELELYDPLVGQAVLELTQEGDVNNSGSTLELWNHGRVEAIAGSAGDLMNNWQVASRNISGSPYSQAHSDSTLQDLAYRIMPSEEGEQIGDAVWLTFYSYFNVSHSVNNHSFSEWTDFPDSDGPYHVKGILSGSYPAPFNVSLRTDDTVRDRPALYADEDYDHSARVFYGERVAAHIGDTIVFNGGVLPWMTIYDYGEDQGMQVGVSERAVSDLSLDTSVTTTLAEEGFILEGPAELHWEARHVHGENMGMEEFHDESGEYFESFDTWQSITDAHADQQSEITSYWLSAGGQAEAQNSAMAVSYYEVEFELYETTSYQLHMIIDASDSATTSFDLSGPTNIAYSASGGWNPRWDTGQLMPGIYTLTVQAEADSGMAGGVNVWANFDFNMNLGEPERVPFDPPDTTILYDKLDLGDPLAWTVETGPYGDASIVGHPDRPDGVLSLFDPGNDAVIIRQLVDVSNIIGIEFDFLFDGPGRLDILLNDTLLTAIYSQGSSGFTYFQDEFTLASVGLSPGEYWLTFKLSNPDAADPQAYLDEMLVTSWVPEPGAIFIFILSGAMLFRRERQ